MSMSYTRKTVRCAAASALATGMLALSAGSALADRNTTVPPERNQTVTPEQNQAGQDAADASIQVLSRIPWDKHGRDRVPKCARHGKLVTSGITDHLKLKNKCRSSVTYHVVLDHHADYWHRVRAHKSWTSSWKWPAKLHKVAA